MAADAADTTAYNRSLGGPLAAPTPAPLERAPFYAVKVVPRDLGTFAGLRGDAHARVLDREGKPIPGLYAAGNDLASIMGGNDPGGGMTPGPALAFGWIAAHDLAGRAPPAGGARHLKAPPAPRTEPRNGARDSRRSAFADALRGFALVGICVVNLPWLASSPSAPPGSVPVLDEAARLLVAALFEGKFFVLFSLLFGFGFQRQLARVRAGGAAPSSYARRLSGLFVLGAAHAVLLFVGDILATYALLGAALWAVRDWTDARLLALARVCAVAAAAGFALLAWGTGAQDAAVAAADAEAARRAYAGGFAEALARRIQDLPTGVAVVLLFNWPLAFAAFCAGVVAGRRGLFDDPARLAAAMPPVPLLAAGAVAGNIAAATAFWLPDGWAVAAYALLAVGAPCLSALYVRGLVRAWRVPRVRAFMEAWLVPGGRMSLSNYLGQSLAANGIVAGWGLGLYGSLGPAALFPLSLAIAATGLAVSTLWLRRFRIGPAERLLRAWSGPNPGGPRLFR